MVNCCCCGKYVFDGQNVRESRRMTAAEYVEDILRPILRINADVPTIIKRFGLNIRWIMNKSECELCGAPHAVWTDQDGDSDEVKQVHFYYSGKKKPCAKDNAFIEGFRSRFLSR